MKAKLISYPKDIERGMMIRCKGQYPYEDIVDFLICESYDSNVGYTLMVASGYKAGLRFVVLPKESIPSTNSGYAISTKWLKEYWNEWGYATCRVEDVWIVANKPPQQ